MKTKLNYLLVFLGCLFFFPLVTNAECSYERQAELSKIASNVQFSYSYEIDKHGFPVFDVYITNVTNDIYILDNYNQTLMGQTEITKKYSSQNESLKFEIYSNDNNCKNKKILTTYLNLPSYNVYSGREECKKYPNFYYCAVWINTLNISSSVFEEEFDKYKQKETLVNIEQKETSDLWGLFDDLFEEYYYILIAILILIVAIILKKRTE